MRKGFVIADFIISTIILSAIGSIFLSTYLMSYQSDKLDFTTQKRMIFESLIKKAEISCRNSINNPESENSYVWDTTKTMDQYTTYVWASCEEVENQPDVKLLSYNTCIYPNEGSSAFVNYTDGNDYSEKYCKSGERYVNN